MEPESKLLKENLAKLERLESKIHVAKAKDSDGQQVTRDNTEKQEKTFSRGEDKTHIRTVQDKEFSGTRPHKMKERRTTGQV